MITDGVEDSRAMHVYLEMKCNTPNCTHRHVVSYLGEEKDIPAMCEMRIPAPLLLSCPRCRQVHDYARAETIRVLRATSPKRGYQDKIAVFGLDSAPPDTN